VSKAQLGKKKAHVLVPLINGMVVDEHRLYLHGAQKALVRDCSIVDVADDSFLL